MEFTQLGGHKWKHWKKCELGTVVLKVRVNPDDSTWSAFVHGNTEVVEEHGCRSEEVAFQRCRELARAMLQKDLAQLGA